MKSLSQSCEVRGVEFSVSSPTTSVTQSVDSDIFYWTRAVKYYEAER
jgi:hypothetical protein